MKIYSNKETWSSKRKRFWAELKNGFRLKNVFGLKKKGNTWAKEKKKGRRWKRKKGGAEPEKKKAEKRWNRKKKKKWGAEGLKQKRERCWNWKAEVLKLKDRGWTGRTETRYIFSIYFPLNLFRKMMVNSFMLNLIFSMNYIFFILGKRCNLIPNYACFSMVIWINSLHVCLIYFELVVSN